MGESGNDPGRGSPVGLGGAQGFDWSEFRVDEATSADTPPLLALRDEAARWLTSLGIDQWYAAELPTAREQADRHIYVLRHGLNVAGTVTLVWEDPFVWGEHAGAAGYIHNLVVARDYSGRSLGRRLLQWAEDRVAVSGRSVARLDCARQNMRLRDLYESVGYHCVRDRMFPELGADRGVALYEKVLPSW